MFTEGAPATRPETPQLHEMETSGQASPRHSPSHSPEPHCCKQSLRKEDPQVLGPGSWNGEEAGRVGCSRSDSRPGSPSPHGYARSPSRQSDRAEQGYDLEIKPLQRMEPKPASTQTVSPHRAGSLGNTDQEKEDPPPSKHSAPDSSPEPTLEAATEPVPDIEADVEIQEPSLERESAISGEEIEPQGEESREKRQSAPKPEAGPTSRAEPSALAKPSHHPVALPEATTPETMTKAETKTATKPAAKLVRTDTNSDARKIMTGKSPAEARDLSEEEVCYQLI